MIDFNQLTYSMDIQEIIAKVDKIKEDFDVINDRIMEFTSSTDKEILDFDLIKIFHSKLLEQKKIMEKYITNMHELALDPRTEINHAGHINLFQTRLSILNNNISSTLNKIKDLEKYRAIDPELIYKNIQNHFVNSEHMDQIRTKLKNLDDLYNSYKENQITYGINLNLDDKVEAELEKKSHNIYLDIEWEYLVWVKSIFKLLEELKWIYEKEWKKTIGIYQNNINKSMIESFDWEFIQSLEIKKDYTLELDIEKSSLWEDLGNLEKKVNEYCKKLKIIATIYDSLGKENVDLLYNNLKKLGLEKLFLLDKALLSTLHKQFSQRSNSIEELTQNIVNLKYWDKSQKHIIYNKYIRYNELLEKIIREYDELQLKKENKWKAENMNFSSIIELISNSFNVESKTTLVNEIEKSSNNLKKKMIKEFNKNIDIFDAMKILEDNLKKIVSIKSSLLEAIKTIANFTYNVDTKKTRLLQIKKLIDNNKYIKNKTTINKYLKIIFNNQYRIKKEDAEREIEYKSSTSSSSSSSRSSPSSRTSSSSRSGGSSSRSSSSSSRSSSSSSSYSSSGRSSR